MRGCQLLESEHLRAPASKVSECIFDFVSKNIAGWQQFLRTDYHRGKKCVCLKDVRKLFRDLVFVSLLTMSLGAVQGEQSAEGQGWLQPSTGDIQRSHLVCRTPVWVYAC